jgi:sugar lactone lactonase YvrE
VLVISPQGKHLGTLQLPEIPANCAWGDAERKNAVHDRAHRSLPGQAQGAWRPTVKVRVITTTLTFVTSETSGA